MLRDQLRVLRHDVRGEVVKPVLRLAVQQEQVPERLRRAHGRLQQKVELVEPVRRIALHVHERDVVKRHRVELFLRPRRHVRERLPKTLNVPHRVLDRRLEVERLHQRGFLQRGGVPHAPDLLARLRRIRRRAHREFGVLPHPPLYYLRQVLQRRAELLGAVVAQRDVVRDVRLESQRLLRVEEPRPRLLEAAFFEHATREVDDDVRIVARALIQPRPAPREVVLLVGDERLQLRDLLSDRRVLAVDGPRRAESLLVHGRLVEALRVMHCVVFVLRE